MTDDPDALDRRFRHVRDAYDARAARHKRRRAGLWAGGLAAAWGPLVLAVVGLGAGLPAAWRDAVLHGAIPALGAVGTAVTAAQVLAAPRGRWLEYRAATEHLRAESVRFRAAVPPYHGPDAAALFAAQLDDLTARLGADHPDRPRRAGGRFGWVRGLAFWRSAGWRLFAGRLQLAVRGRPADLRGEPDRPPDDGLFPRLADLPPADRAAAVRGRLRHQRAWHLGRAGRHYAQYLALQGLVAGAGAAVAAYSYFVGRSLVWYGVGAAAGLTLMAWRDFLDCGPLSLRYYRLAGSLADLEDRLTGLAAAAGPEGVPADELAAVAYEGERRIGGEFRAWQSAREAAD